MRQVARTLWLVVALGCLLVAIWLHYVGRSSFAREFWLLLGLAGVAGLAVARWWALVFAPLPWLAGVGYGLYTGRYLFLGEAWQVIWFASAAVCLLGIALGWGAGRLLDEPLAQPRRRQRTR